MPVTVGDTVQDHGMGDGEHTEGDLGATKAADDPHRTALFVASPLGSAVRDWLEFVDRILAFNDLMHLGIVAVRPAVTLTTLAGALFNKLDDQQKSVANRHISWATHEIDNDFELMHALILVAAWGSFEAFIEDVCKAMLAMDPRLLASKPFSKVTIPVSVLASDPIEQIDLIFTEASKKLNTDLGTGKGKFEALLKLVGLDGEISHDLCAAIYHAQQTRNVWAHRSGKADKRFVKECPKLGLSVGDTVKITTEQTNTYLRAIMVYGVLVVNRGLAAHNIGPMPFPGDEGSPFADPYAKLWGTTPKDQPVTGWFEETNPVD